MAESDTSLPSLPLPDSISEDYIDCLDSCGLKYHVLQAGKKGRPLVLFCHGYPELAFSWRKVIPAVAEAGYFCVAMDQRGYGRTTGWANVSYDQTDLSQYTMTNLVRDLVCLVYRLGYKTVHTIVGHDFGGVSSAMAALIRPDVFLATIQLSHPHHAPPPPAFGDEPQKPKIDIQAELAKLDPPRKHYKYYNSTAYAASEWNAPAQGLETFLRGYFHLKSADWAYNDPHPLTAWDAQGVAALPEYYVMRKERSMPETVADNMQGEDATITERWLSANDLKIYCAEWERTGFQGALSWYRAQTESTAQSARDMFLFAGRKMAVPCMFISGKQDWGNFQQPGAFQSYEDDNVIEKGCSRGVALIDGAGHWVQQEQPEAVIKEILAFMKTL